MYIYYIIELYKNNQAKYIFATYIYISVYNIYILITELIHLPYSNKESQL